MKKVNFLYDHAFFGFYLAVSGWKAGRGCFHQGAWPGITIYLNRYCTMYETIIAPKVEYTQIENCWKKDAIMYDIFMIDCLRSQLLQ